MHIALFLTRICQILSEFQLFKTSLTAQVLCQCTYIYKYIRGKKKKIELGFDFHEFSGTNQDDGWHNCHRSHIKVGFTVIIFGLLYIRGELQHFRVDRKLEFFFNIITTPGEQKWITLYYTILRYSFKTLKKCDVIWYRPREKVVYDCSIRGTNMEKSWFDEESFWQFFCR